jgi:hypothetical protein
MDAIAPALIGIGLWLAYEAWTNPSPTPIASFKARLGMTASPASTVTPLGPAGSATQPATESDQPVIVSPLTPVKAQ